MVIASIGIIGNFLSFSILLSRKTLKTFHNLLFLLCSFDLVSSDKKIISCNAKDPSLAISDNSYHDCNL